MVEKGILEYSTRGVYILPERFDDELFNLQNRLKKVLFLMIRHYIFWFSDRTLSKFDMTFPVSYNTSSIKTRSQLTE